MSEKVVFTEKQYLGREFIPLSIRLVLAIFCFAAYAFTDVGDKNGDLLAVRNGGPLRVVALRSADDWKSATLVGTGTFSVPATTAAVVGDAVYVVHPQMSEATVAPVIERVAIQ